MTVGNPPRVLLVTPDPKDNSLGRTYCLWLLGVFLDWDLSLVTIEGSEVWAPLAETDMARRCVFLRNDARGPLVALADHVRRADLVIAVKPVVATLGAVAPIAKSTGTPLIVDVDDPDVEVRTVWRPWRERIPRRLVQSIYQERVRLGKLARSLPTMVSNPTLGAIYGGPIVPHVRSAVSRMPHGPSEAPVVRFVGSPKGHKGVDILRAAVANLAGLGYTLEVTADPPSDAQPWESWLGKTTFERGQHLAATADITVIPSLNTAWAPGQLPAKLIDAMMFGRAIVASDLPPIRWALGDGGLLVPPGDVGALSRALGELRNGTIRDSYGERAHARATNAFSVEAVAPVVRDLVESVLRSHPAAASGSKR